MAGSGESRSSSSSKGSKSSKRRPSSSEMSKEEESAATSSHRAASSKKKSTEKMRRVEDVAEEAQRGLADAQSVDSLRSKKKSHRDKADDEQRSSSERTVRKRRVKTETDASSDARQKRSKKTEARKEPEPRKSSLAPIGSERVEQPKKCKSTPPTKEALAALPDKDDAWESGEEEMADGEESARRNAAQPSSEAQLQVDRETIELVQKMHAHLASLEEALRLSQEENMALHEKVEQMNIDVRDVQLQMKKLNKQHADEVIDRFKQYERLFSTSILTVQSAAEKCIGSVQEGVRDVIKATLAEHKESLSSALERNLDTISKAGNEQVAALKKQLAEEMERLSSSAATQHKELAERLGESAVKKAEPSEITRQLLLTLVEQTFAAMGGADDDDDDDSDGEGREEDASTQRAAPSGDSAAAAGADEKAEEEPAARASGSAGE